MKLGSFEIPDLRLIPTSVGTLDEIYKVKTRSRIPSKDLAILLGFKYGTESHYYRKIHALIEYGLMEGKGIFQVSELGERVLHPRSDQEKALAITNAVLNVALWKEIYQKHGKKPRADNFWAVLVDITKVDPETAKKNASKILGWYEEDIAHVSENIIQEKIMESKEDESKGLSSDTSNIRSVSQQLASTPNFEKLEFGKSVVLLPKKDIKKEWEKLQKHMEIFLEDYQESAPESEEQPQE